MKMAFVRLVNHYTAWPPKFVNLFTEWLGIIESALQFVLDEIRNSEIWERDDDWCWRRRPSSEYLAEPEGHASLSQTAEFSEFTVTPTYRSTGKQDGVVLYPQGDRP